MKSTKKRIDNNETKVEFSDNVVIPTLQVEEFLDAIEKVVSEFAI